MLIVVLVHERAHAVEYVDLVFLHQELDAVDVGLFTTLVLAVDHLVHVHLQVVSSMPCSLKVWVAL